MQYDILIIGSGLVGASLAAALIKQGFKIAIIDKIALSEPDQNFNARALALSQTSLRYLKELGVWDPLENQFNPIQAVHTSEQGRFGVARITASQHSLPYLGGVIEANLLNYTLNQLIEKSDQLSIFREREIKTLRYENNVWQIELSDQSTLQAHLLVGADGVQSFLRSHLGIGSSLTTYPSLAILANLSLKRSHEDVAYERFTNEGSIAMLPFGEKRVKCVWILPTQTAKSVYELSETDFLKKLQQDFGHRLGRFEQVGKRMMLPLCHSISESLYGAGWVLMGSAAELLHPIAAQGFNLGLRDVSTFAALLAAARRREQCISDIAILKQYAENRLPDHRRIRQFTDQLMDASVQRRIGLLSCVFIPAVNEWVAKLGMGSY